MGKYNNGINGPFRGKVGKVVGSSTKGVDYMKSLPEISTKAPTENQRRYRLVFAMISSWLKPLKDIINVGFQLLEKGKTPMNIAHGLLTTGALVKDGNETRIDFKSVILSRGELLISIITGIVSLVDSIVQLSWKNASTNALNNPNDLATFVIYNPVKNRYATFVAEVSREAEEVSLQLPITFTGDMVHCWMHYVNVEGNKVSSTTYAGEIMVV